MLALGIASAPGSPSGCRPCRRTWKIARAVLADLDIREMQPRCVDPWPSPLYMLRAAPAQPPVPSAPRVEIEPDSSCGNALPEGQGLDSALGDHERVAASTSSSGGGFCGIGPCTGRPPTGALRNAFRRRPTLPVDGLPFHRRRARHRSTGRIRGRTSTARPGRSYLPLRSATSRKPSMLICDGQLFPQHLYAVRQI